MVAWQIKMCKLSTTNYHFFKVLLSSQQNRMSIAATMFFLSFRPLLKNMNLTSQEAADSNVNLLVGPMLQKENDWLLEKCLGLSESWVYQIMQRKIYGWNHDFRSMHQKMLWVQKVHFHSFQIDCMLWLWWCWNKRLDDTFRKRVLHKTLFHSVHSAF